MVGAESGLWRLILERAAGILTSAAAQPRSWLSESQAVSDHECDFGRWYFGEGQAIGGHIAEFAKLETPDAELHRSIREIIQLQRARRKTAAEAVYERVAALSHQVVELIEAVEAKSAKAAA